MIKIYVLHSAYEKSRRRNDLLKLLDYTSFLKHVVPYGVIVCSKFIIDAVSNLLRRTSVVTGLTAELDFQVLLTL